jgi:hypothetical protein
MQANTRMEGTLDQDLDSTEILMGSCLASSVAFDSKPTPMEYFHSGAWLFDSNPSPPNP